MAGQFPFAKYDALDWVRVPGSSTRNYRNVLTGDVISRRQYKQHYAPSIPSLEPLLQPARGRTSARRLPPTEKEVILGQRKVQAKQKQAAKKIQRAAKRKPRPPHSFNLKSFHPKYRSKAFGVPPDVDVINSIRIAAQRSRNVYAYIVGLSLIDEDTGAERTVSLFAARSIRDPFTDEDFRQGEDEAETLHVNGKSGNLVSVGWWMRVFLTRAAAEKNGVKFPESSLLRPRGKHG